MTISNLREARTNEAEAIAACLRAAFEPYRALYTPGAFADTSPESEGIARRFQSMTILVANDERELVIGTIAFSVSGKEGHLRGMAVRTEAQGQGVAEALIRAAEGDLRKRGCTHVTLDVTAPLERATAFYRKMGYSDSGRRSDFFGMELKEFAKTLELAHS